MAMRVLESDVVATTLFDRESALARVGDDEELLAELVRIFLADYPSSVREMEQALAQGNSQLLERAAHSLKGAVANFGAEDVVSEAFALEKMGRAGDLSHANSNLERLCRVLSQLHEELRPLAD
jgi:HPt (histidine-containing phosphotransfer) domain-containing protein